MEEVLIFLVSICCMVEVEIGTVEPVIFLLSTGCLPNNPNLVTNPRRAMSILMSYDKPCSADRGTPSYNSAGLLRNCPFESSFEKSQRIANPAPSSLQEVQLPSDWPSCLAAGGQRLAQHSTQLYVELPAPPPPACHSSVSGA